MAGNIDDRRRPVYVSGVSHQSDVPAAAAPDPAYGRTAVLATDGLLVLMAVIWGVNFSVVKYGAGVMSPLAFNGARIGVAAVALAGLAFIPRPARIAPRDLGALLLLGVLGNCVYQVLFIEGVALTRAGDAALVVAASPALIALLGRATGVEHTSRRGAVGIALSILGVGVVMYTGTRAAARGASVLGDLLVLGGSMAWALYTVLLTPYTRRVDGVTLSAYTMIGGAVALELVALPEISRISWTTLPGGAWAAMLYSGIGALVIAYLFWYRGVRVIGPTRSAMYSNLQPLVALLVAWPMLGEVPTAWQVLGAACIMSGLLLTRT
ncbi:MAG TPA: DMT family transporter [Gemmatimonadaceae bacterium]|nr:DMT family transporter [Gemmatimonadaceae bacterium]